MEVILDKEAIRKCITDINIMNKIKEQGILENKHEKIIRVLDQKLCQIDEKER